MKTNSKGIFVTRTVLFILFSLYFLTVFGQSDYSFKNAVLISGPALQTGAKYKFSNVKNGLDVFVTITGKTGGFTLTEIDNQSTGYDEAFQPTVKVPENAEGYVEFLVEFADAGKGIAQVQNLVPITCTSVDGANFTDGVMYAMDQVQFFPGYYNYSITGNKLEISTHADWLVINNTSGIKYSQIDTTAKDLMATVVNKNVSKFLIRIGARNNSSTHSEFRTGSFYFKAFGYGHMNTLPNRTMLSFSGAKKQNFVELKGLLSPSHSYDKLVIERAVSPNVFGQIGKMDISGIGNSDFNFTFLDTKPENGTNYYRIRLVGTSTNIQEISNTLMVKMENNPKEVAVINSILNRNNPLLTIQSPGDSEADLLLADLSGRIILNIKSKLNSGINNINLPVFGTAKGNFVLVVKTKNNTISKQVMVQ